MTTETAASEQQLVVFDLAQERYGVDIHSVREIIRYQAITTVPDAPFSVAGVINLRGSVIPVVDLRRRLGLAARAAGPETRIVVIEAAGAQVGVIVDAVAEVLRLSTSAVEQPPAAVALSSNAYVRGIVRYGEALTLLLDIEGALSPAALAALREYAAEVPAAAPAAAATAEAPRVPTLADLDIELLEATFEVVKPRAQELVEYFYDRLFQLYPSVVPLFANADMQEQSGKLLSAIALVVASLRNPEALVPALQGLGARHVAYGAQPAHYEAVGGVLLESLAFVAGEAWDDRAARAWGDAYTVAATVMIEAAAAVPVAA